MLRLCAAGSNARGQLGSGDCEDQHTFKPALFARQVEGKERILPDLPPRVSSVLEVACGANHTLVLFDNHEIWVSGDSSRGQLASVPATTVFRQLSFDRASYNIDEQMFPINVAALWETSYVVYGSEKDSELSDIVISFGANDFGDRGVGPSPPTEPSVVDFQQALPGKVLRIKVREIATGQRHILASLEVWEESHKPYMAVVGWGASRHGQLGALPAGTKKLEKKSSRVVSQAETRFDKPVVVAIYTGEERPIQLAAGAQHSLILHSTHRLTALGSSRHGQLDFPKKLLEPATHPHALRTIGCTWSSSFFVTYRPPQHNTLRGGFKLGQYWWMDSCGRSNHGQLGHIPPENSSFGILPEVPGFRDFIRLACGSEHVLMFTDQGVCGWGWNEHGNLGLGHTNDVPKPLVVFDADSLNTVGRDQPPILALGAWAGCGTSWILVWEKET